MKTFLREQIDADLKLRAVLGLRHLADIANDAVRPLLCNPVAMVLLVSMEAVGIVLHDIAVADGRDLRTVHVVDVEVNREQTILLAPLQTKQILAVSDDHVRGVDVVGPAKFGAEVLRGGPHGLISWANV